MKGFYLNMKYVVGFPYIVKNFRDELMSTCKLENVFEIDNTVFNRGFAGSHNLGIQKMYEENADWYIVMSAAVRFGDLGGLDFIEVLKNTEHVIVESLGVFGWHFIAFHRTLIDKVGLWDTNLTPYGYEDLDYSMRIQRAVLLDYDEHWKKIIENRTVWQKVQIDIKDTIMAHSLKLGGVEVTMGETREYYNKKWGRYPSTSEDAYNSFFYPFNNSENGLGYFPTEYYEKWLEKERNRVQLSFSEVDVTCQCGNVFKSLSATGNLTVDTCGACDPCEFMQDGTKK